LNPDGIHLTDSILGNKIAIIITITIIATLQYHHHRINRNQATTFLVSHVHPPTVIALPSVASLPSYQAAYFTKMANHRVQCLTKKKPWFIEWTKCLFTAKAGMDIDTMEEGRPHHVFIPETQNHLHAAGPITLLKLAINAADPSNVRAATLIGNHHHQ
jgi:hypothetical protein